MFVRQKRQGKQVYYYLVKSYREEGKVRKKVVKYLGKEKPSPEELERLTGEIKRGQ
jgi:hypothetical protein